MIQYVPTYRGVELEELVKGFSFEKKLSSGTWVPNTLQENPTSLELDFLYELILQERLRVASYEPVVIEPEVQKPTFWEKLRSQVETFLGNKLPFLNPKELLKYAYTSFFSIFHILAWWGCYLVLNHLDTLFPSSVDASIMGTGDTLLKYAMYCLGVHLSCVTAANIVHWTLPGLNAYAYVNPFVRGEGVHDLTTDLNNSQDLQAKTRSRCYLNTFWRLYFVALAIMGTVFVLNQITRII